MLPFAICFARAAAREGWRRSLLLRLCERRGISGAERDLRWPRGVRSVARELNAEADRRTVAYFRERRAEQMAEIILARFEDNRRLKPSVRRLAWSDLRHPIDTLHRTAQTSRAMWRCHVSGASAGTAKHYRLTLAYSLCVLVWLADRSDGDERTRRLTPVILKLMCAN